MSPAMMGHATDTSDMRASETKSIAMTLPFSPLRERAVFESTIGILTNVSGMQGAAMTDC